MNIDRKNISVDLTTYEIYYREAERRSTPRKRVTMAEILRENAKKLKKKHEATTLS